MASSFYIIAASPLVRVYLPEWHDRILEKPEILESMEPFDFIVNTGSGGLRVKFNTPMHISSLGRKLTDEKEMQSLFDWLIGDPLGQRTSESDIYGIVAFDPGVDLTTTQDSMALLEMQVSEDPKVAAKARYELEKMRKETAQKIKTTREGVRKLADSRITRAMRNIHNNLTRQWAINEQQKMGNEIPSTTEQIGAVVLSSEISAAKSKGAKIKENMNKLMQDRVV